MTFLTFLIISTIETTIIEMTPSDMTEDMACKALSNLSYVFGIIRWISYIIEVDHTRGQQGIELGY